MLATGETRTCLKEGGREGGEVNNNNNNNNGERSDPFTVDSPDN